MAREAELVTKSNLILGMGEDDHEIEQAIRDLHEAGCDILTITQYLRPSKLHHPIDRWVKPEEFVHWTDVAEEMGFKGVMAGPLVRSSYRAGRLWATAMGAGDAPIPEHLSHLAEAAEHPARQEAASLVARGLDRTRILTRMARKEKQQSTRAEEAGTTLPDPPGLTAAPGRPGSSGGGCCWPSWASLVVAVGIGVLVGHWIYALILGLPLGLLAATLVMSRRAERAAYARSRGSPVPPAPLWVALRAGWFYRAAARGCRRRPRHPARDIVRGLRLPRA